MKKCPFCKANIEDSARFCLYCMKPLNEKEEITQQQRKKPWWILIVAALLLVFVFWVLSGKIASPGDFPAETNSPSEGLPSQTDAPTQSVTQEPTNNTLPTVMPTHPATQNDTAVPTIPTERPTQPSTESPTVAPTQPLTNAPTAAPTQPVTNAPTAAPTQQVTNKPTTAPTQSVTNAPTAAPTQPVTNAPTAAPTQPVTNKPTAEPTQAATQPENEVAYSYRLARSGDDFNAGYQNSGGDIVITGIAKPAADGVYEIPAYIDGKKVISIAANAFSGSNARVVYIPQTVKNIWNYAFADCALTDIYFRGNAIYTESKAFSGHVTIHCAATCSDRNFRYYKNCAEQYGATWVEWNG